MKPEGAFPYTYKEYVKWEGRWELIDGTPYNMTPAPTWNHQFTVGELLFAFRSFFGNKNCYVAVAPFDVRLSEDDNYENATNIMQPDVSVVCNKKQLTKSGCNGTPTLIVEVLSPSTALKDRNEKYKKYQQFGVKEYWIVDPTYKMIEVHGLEDSFFKRKEVFGENQELKSFVFPDLTVKLKNIFYLDQP